MEDLQDSPPALARAGAGEAPPRLRRAPRRGRRVARQGVPGIGRVAISTLSHELRSPLNTILCFQQLLETGVLGNLTEAQRDALARVGSATRRVCDLVDDLFAVAELENPTPSLELERTDVLAIVDAVLARLHPTADDRGLVLRREAAGPMHWWTDPVGFERLVTKLCLNGLNATETGGVTIRLLKSAGALRIEVVDTGPGDDPGELQDVLDRLTEMPPSLAARALSLTVADRWSGQLGGRLERICTPGGGSTCTVHLVDAGRAD